MMVVLILKVFAADTDGVRGWAGGGGNVVSVGGASSECLGLFRIVCCKFLGPKPKVGRRAACKLSPRTVTNGL